MSAKEEIPRPTRAQVEEAVRRAPAIVRAIRALWDAIKGRRTP